MTKSESILQHKALRITPMRQLLLEHFIQEDKILGLTEFEDVFISGIDLPEGYQIKKK